MEKPLKVKKRGAEQSLALASLHKDVLKMHISLDLKCFSSALVSALLAASS